MTALIHAHKLHAGTDAAKLFFKELMENVETLTGIADRYGPRTLADVMYLQNAILDGSFIELFPDESAVLDIVDELPSAAIWRKFVQTVASATTTLRRDVPNEILEMLLFEGEPKGRSREDLEARYAGAAGIPYIARWLGVPESEATQQPAVQAKAEVKNHYLCSCGQMWQTTWSGPCSESCPACDRETSPYVSDDGTLSDAEINQALKRVADMRQYLISEPPNAWPHIFAGFGEMAVRFVFSRKLNAIIALHVHYGKGWQKATLEQVADVQDSLTNANVEAIADPYGSGFGLIAADHLPAWA